MEIPTIILGKVIEEPELILTIILVGMLCGSLLNEQLTSLEKCLQDSLNEFLEDCLQHCLTKRSMEPLKKYDIKLIHYISNVWRIP